MIGKYIDITDLSTRLIDRPTNGLNICPKWHSTLVIELLLAGCRKEVRTASL